MYNSNRRLEMKSGLPLFAKVFIAFVCCGALAVFAMVATIAYFTISTIANPEQIGSYVGKIQSGYEQAVGK